MKSLFLCFILLFPTIAPAFSAYSNDELDQLEKEFLHEINHSNAILRHALANDYINQLAQRLAKHGQTDPTDFFIVKSNEINAFAGPGGHIGINTQLVLETDSESELAGVMAHEMAHVRQHHLYRMLEHQKQMRVPMLATLLASIALGVINPALSTGALYGVLSGFAQDSINFVRSGEKEADSIGIDMLKKSGLDPHGMPNFFKKLQMATRYRYTANVPAILRTHPLDEERIAEAENRCPAGPQKGQQDQSQYLLFKELIRNEVHSDPKTMLDYYTQRCRKDSSDACHYGYGLHYLHENQYSKARDQFTPLWHKDPSNVYYAIAMAQTYEGLMQPQQAVQLLEELHHNFPDVYALTMEYAKALIAASQPQKAAALLLVGSRQYKEDIQLCEELARAQAASHQLSYAYFTLAQCHLLQGEAFDAMRKLKLAKTYAKKDRLLLARIAAKMEEIKANDPRNKS